jgi:hypothetical protein
MCVAQNIAGSRKPREHAGNEFVAAAFANCNQSNVAHPAFALPAALDRRNST